MAKLLLLRHGQSSFNNESRFCGWIDAPLTEIGCEQAKNSAILLKNNELTKDIPIHLLVTSRLQRAVLTSNIILENIGRMDMDEIKTWRLNERHYGSFQGIKKNLILNKFGKDKYIYYRRAYSGCPPECDIESEYYKDTLRIAKFDFELRGNPKFVPKCESLEMVINRLIPFWEGTMKRRLENGENILCVTHGSVVRGLLTILYKLNNEEVENLNIPNGMPILIEFDEESFIPKKWIYLEPERAKIEAELIKHEGLH